MKTAIPENHPANSLIDIVKVTKRYGSFTAVSEVSFSIKEGETLGLIGPNGSGKTSLFECLGGVLPFESGEILHRGRPLTRADRASVLFYLPDAIAPWPTQTVIKSLHFMVGLFDGHLDVGQIVHALGLEPLLHKRIETLSKGQRKRALLAMGLLMPQPLLVADEPFDGLDLRQTREVAATLRFRAANCKRTMLLSIHQIADAARVCDRFVLLSAGKVCGQGTLDELSTLAASRGGAEQSGNLEEVFLALT